MVAINEQQERAAAIPSPGGPCVIGAGAWSLMTGRELLRLKRIVLASCCRFHLEQYRRRQRLVNAGWIAVGIGLLLIGAAAGLLIAGNW